MKHLKSIDSFSEPISEARVTVKRRYTESHPAKNISTAARVRNSVIEAMGDGVLTEEELSKILQELKAHKRWLGRNTKLFNISEDQNGIKSYTLSPFGKRVKSKTITVNESKEDFKPHMMYDPETGKGYKAETYEDHVRMDKMGYVHEDPNESVSVNEMDTYAKDILDNYKKDIYAFIKKINKEYFSGEDGALVADSLAMVLTDIAKNEMKHDRFINESKYWTLLHGPGDFVTDTSTDHGISKDPKDAVKYQNIKIATKAANEFKRKHGVNVMVHVMDEGINEASRWKGKEIYPDWVKPSDLDGFVKSINDLEVGKDYAFYEPGMDSWQAEYTYKGTVGSGAGFGYKFTSQIEPSPPEEFFSKADMADMIKDLELVKMK